MDYQNFKVETNNYITQVIFNRPDKANSMTLASWDEMQSIFETLSNDPKTRVIILRGEGKHFCAGMDLQTLMSIPQKFNGEDKDQQKEQIKSFILHIQETISSIEKCSKPVIASIHGACVGGGINIATACDMRYASDDSFISVKEVDLGIVADIGVLQRLPNIINPSIAAELAYTGRKVMGAEAAQIGLVSKSYVSKELLDEEVMKLATTIAEKSPKVIRGIKAMLLYKRDHTTQDALKHMADYNSVHLLSNDLMEAMMANMEKRKPKFED